MTEDRERLVEEAARAQDRADQLATVLNRNTLRRHLMEQDRARETPCDHARLQSELAAARTALVATWDAADQVYGTLAYAGHAGVFDDIMDAHRDAIDAARAALEPQREDAP